MFVCFACLICKTLTQKIVRLEQGHPRARDYGTGCILSIKDQKFWKVFFCISVWPSTGPTQGLSEDAITKTNRNGLKLCSSQRVLRHDLIHAIAITDNHSITECFKGNENGTPK